MRLPKPIISNCQIKNFYFAGFRSLPEMRNLIILFIVWSVVIHVTICYQSAYGDVVDQLNTFLQQSDAESEYISSVNEAAHGVYDEEPFEDDLEENEPYEYQRTSALRSPPIPVPQSVPEPESTDNVRYQSIPQMSEETDLSTEGNVQPKEQVSKEEKDRQDALKEALRKSIAELVPFSE
jgi:hypothetical protein